MPNEDNKNYIKYHYGIYKKINNVGCSAFKNEKIFFIKKGFRHLIYKNNNRRTELDYKERINLIKYAPFIIKNSLKYGNYRLISNGKHNIYFWSLEKRYGNKNIILIIRQIDNGNKHFFSIMIKK